MNRWLFLGILIAGLSTAATAASANFTATDQPLRPGTNQSLGNLTIQADSANTSIEETTHTFPFPVALVNQTATTANNTTTITADVFAAPSSDYPSGNYTHKLFLSLPNDSITQPVSYTVPEVGNWSVTTNTTNRTLSVGSDGIYLNLTVDQRGNTVQTIDTNLTGNLSQLLSPPTSLTARPNNPDTAAVTYDLDPSTPFGTYTGTLRLSTQNTTRAMNLTATVVDNIAPEIRDTTFPDLMATTTETLSIVAGDNLAVDTVTANITRPVTVTVNNSTVTRNRTVVNASFTQTSEPEIWSYTFEDTAERSTYTASITVTDTAGNTATTTEQFTVTDLNTTRVTAPDLQMDAIPASEEGSRAVIVNDQKSPFNVTRDSFTYAGNATLKIGLRHEDDDAATYFDDTDTLQFSQPGQYEVVVNSFAEEPVAGTYDYTSQLSVQVPEQHVPVDDLVVNGMVDASPYPIPQAIRVGEFDGYIGYGNAINRFIDLYGEPEPNSSEYAYVVGRVNKTQCRDGNRWGDCTSLTMGQYEQVRDDNEDLRRQNRALSTRLYLSIAVGLFGLFLIWRCFTLAGLLKVNRPVNPDNFTIFNGDSNG